LAASFFAGQLKRSKSANPYTWTWSSANAAFPFQSIFGDLKVGPLAWGGKVTSMNQAVASRFIPRKIPRSPGFQPVIQRSVIVQ